MKFISIFRAKYRGIYISDMILTLGTFIVSSFFVSMERSLLLCFLLGTIGVVLNMKWYLRSRSWFWLVIGSFFLFNISLIFALPMPHEFKMAAAFSPLVIAEGMALLGIISLIEHRNKLR